MRAANWRNLVAKKRRKRKTKYYVNHAFSFVVVVAFFLSLSFFFFFTQFWSLIHLRLILIENNICHSTRTLYVGRCGLDRVYSHVLGIGGHVCLAGNKSAGAYYFMVSEAGFFGVNKGEMHMERLK